ncbi:MAG: hypothetical protein OSB14_09065, partial [Planctomycetota bacterium]|nr:hypothetical protein [Planctomycetota bacterium]
MRIQSLKSPLFLFAAALLGSSPAFAQASWTPLGSGTANDMSADGDSVVGDNGSGYLWTASGGQLSLGSDDAVAVSSAGTVVLGNIVDTAGNDVAGLWSQSNGWVSLGGIGGSSGGSVSTAYAMSGDGNVATGLAWVNAGTAGAFRWSATGGMTALPQAGSGSSRGNAVSDDGSFIGGWEEAGNGTRRAVIWDAALAQTFVLVTPSNATGAGEVWGFSENNQYVAGVTQGQGFVWDAVNGRTLTGTLPSTDSFRTGEARGVSNDGQVVVGWYRVAFPFDVRATIWTPADGIQELKSVLISNGATGVPSLRMASAISADGTKILAYDGSGWGIADLGTGGTSGSYCFGDGSGIACPCGNAGTSGAGCANSAGAGATLSRSGIASASSSGLVLESTGLVPGQPGLYFQGNNAIAGGQGTSFGDGIRCAGGSVIRLQVRAASSSGVSSTTINIATKGAVSGGDLRRYQLWYRDPNLSLCGFGYNLTNGVEV